VTEVPENLLRRSREGRAALGLGGESESGGEAPPATAAVAAPSEAETPVARSTEVEAAEAPGGAIALLEEAPPPRPVPTRAKTPIWIMPVLVCLPVYAFIYLGAFGSRAAAVSTPVSRGAVVYTSNCAVCHGASGEGGQGPKLASGEAAKTFPNVADQINWVHTGSIPFLGKKYGDPNRAGGQHVATKGIMPAFGGALSDQQIQDVVAYERQGL
jgi:mono/diheme cytochrome c family protein